MKRFAILLILVLSVCLLFSGCSLIEAVRGKKDSPPSHSHTYKMVITKPTDISQGYTTYTCECGNSYVSDYTDALTASEGMLYQLNENGDAYTLIFRGSCKDQSIVIPTFYNGLPVTAIADDAFYRFEDILSVVIPNGVTSIGEGAFCECTSLTIVSIPNSVTEIGDYAFNSCNLIHLEIPSGVKSIGYGAFAICENLTRVTISETVSNIEDAAFCMCQKLTDIKVSAENPNYKSIDGHLYTKDGKILKQYAIGKSNTSFSIPNEVTEIAMGAFCGCELLTDLVLPQGVKTIGEVAFAECSNLINISIPNTATFIGESAFEGCLSITTITIPSSVSYIGSYAFNFCPSLTNITFENPNGWKAGNTDISAIDLSNSETAAQYLENTYRNNEWHRN